MLNVNNKDTIKDYCDMFNPKRAGGQFDRPLCFFQNCSFYGEGKALVFLEFLYYHNTHSS